MVIDARPIAAFAAGHIPGAVSIELRPAFAMTAASLLERAGHHDLRVLDGGTGAWADAGRRLEASQ